MVPRKSTAASMAARPLHLLVVTVLTLLAVALAGVAAPADASDAVPPPGPGAVEDEILPTPSPTPTETPTPTPTPTPSPSESSATEPDEEPKGPNEEPPGEEAPQPGAPTPTEPTPGSPTPPPDGNGSGESEGSKAGTDRRSEESPDEDPATTSLGLATWGPPSPQLSPADGAVYWDLVAECATGGDWSAHLSGGRYGGLALSVTTWKSAGGDRYADRPDLASRLQQIEVAASLDHDAWPDCPQPLDGSYTTDRLEDMALRLRSLGWSTETIQERVYTPFIIGGPAAWSDTWGAPRHGPGDLHRTHQGQDVFCHFDTPVLAVTTGTVEFSQGGLGGKVARLRLSDGSYWYYAHLSDWNTAAFSDGDVVQAGDVLGYCGDTGNALGGSPHVHFGYYGPGGGAIDPMPHLVSWLRSAERQAEGWVQHVEGRVIKASRRKAFHRRSVDPRVKAPIRARSAVRPRRIGSVA